MHFLKIKILDHFLWTLWKKQSIKNVASREGVDITTNGSIHPPISPCILLEGRSWRPEQHTQLSLKEKH